MADEKNEKTLATYGPMLDIWCKEDEFVLEFLHRISDKMETANSNLKERIQKMFEMRVENNTKSSKISEVLDSTIAASSESGLGKLQEYLEAENLIDSDIKALFGVIHYSMLLHKRLSAFQQICGHLYRLNAESGDVEKMRANLIEFGPRLQHIWKHCESECRSADEIRIFEKHVYEETKKAS